MNCKCENFEPRTTTNLIREIITCKNCGRTEPVGKAAIRVLNEFNAKPLQPALGEAIKCKQNNKMYVMGGLYEFKDESDRCWGIGRLVDINGGQFKSNTGTKREWFYYIREVSIEAGTITDAPIELIDGKAYQFDYMNKTRVGYYCSDNDQLMFRGGWGRGSVCTNIKLLEVK